MTVMISMQQQKGFLKGSMAVSMQAFKRLKCPKPNKKLEELFSKSMIELEEVEN